MRIKAISLWQPWATLIAIEAKRYETRGWANAYRGPLAIHAAKKSDADVAMVCQQSPYREVLAAAGYGRFEDLPLGQIVAVVDLTAIYHTEDVRGQLSQQELAFGDFSDGRAAWKCENVRRLKQPVPTRGAQRLWYWTVPAKLVRPLGLES